MRLVPFGSAALSVTAALAFALTAGAAWADVTIGVRDEPEPATLSARDEAAVVRAEERGALLYAFDQAGWQSTDAMLKVIPDPVAAGVKGFIVEPKGHSLYVTYYGLDQDTPKAIYTAEVVGDTVLTGHLVEAGEDTAVSPLAARMIAARAVALKRSFKPCTDVAMNALVLPPASEDGPISVYVTSAQARRGVYPFGGHYEVDVAADGKVVGSRKFTNACLNLDVNAAGGDESARAAIVSHNLDPTPTEIHVWLSLWMHKPVFVGTRAGRVWAVDGDQIHVERP